MVGCKGLFDSKVVPTVSTTTGNHTTKRKTGWGAPRVCQDLGSILWRTTGGKWNTHSTKQEICSRARGMDICEIEFLTMMCKPGIYLRTTTTRLVGCSSTTDAGARCNECTDYWFTENIDRSTVSNEYGRGENTCNRKAQGQGFFKIMKEAISTI